MEWRENIKRLYRLSDKSIFKIISSKWLRMAHLYPIKDKQGKIITLDLNNHQEKIKEAIKEGKMLSILKSRQVGITTFFCIFYLDEVIFNQGVNAVIQAHKQESLDSIFRIVKLAFDFFPNDLVGLKRSEQVHNKKEIFIPENNSRIAISLEVRSTSVTHVHFSELAFTEKDRYDATIGSLSPKSYQSIESTPNGLNYFYDLYRANSRSDLFKNFFIPWFEEDSYKIPIIKTKEEFNASLKEDEKMLIKNHGLSLEQINFRKEKMKQMGRLKFFQEYAENDIECFLSSGSSVCDKKNLMEIRNNAQEPVKEYLDKDMFIKVYGDLNDEEAVYKVGVDTAEGVGKDYTAVQILKYKESSVKQVCSMRGYLSPISLCMFLKKFVEENFYSYPEIVVERNNHGHAVISSFLHNEECYYDHLYYSMKDSKAGFLTTRISKMAILTDLFSIIDNRDIELNCLETIDEILSLIVKDNGTFSHEEGKHDDLVMALAFSLHGVLNYKKGEGLRV